MSVNGGAWNLLSSTAAGVTAYRDATASAGGVRRYRVRAWNASGPGAPVFVTATTVGVGIPTAPRNLTAAAAGPSAIDLDWDAPFSPGGSAIVRYEIHVLVSGIWSLLGSTTAGVTAYRDTRATAGTARHYRVWAVNAYGPGAPAYVDAPAAGPPGPPREPGCAHPQLLGDRAELGRPARRRRQRDHRLPDRGLADGGARWSTLDRNTGRTATSYRHTGLPGGTAHHYRVAAINAIGAGGLLRRRQRDDGPGRPGRARGLSARAQGTSDIALTWTAPVSDGGSPVTGYRIEWSRTGSSPWTEADKGSRTTGYTHSGLAPGTTRHYRVRAINRAGPSAWSSVARATTDVTIPGAPTGLRAVASLRGSNQLLLTWTRPSANGGSAITGYLIQMSLTGVSGWTQVVANTRSATTTYLHSGLAPGTTRYYRVAAINDQGPGAFSAPPVEGTTRAAPPGPPQNLRAQATGPRSITLTWQAPASDGGARITGYSVRARGPHDGTWITIQRNTGSTATTFAHTNLQPASAYRYQVAAINSVGASPWSPEAGTITHPDVPAAPTGLTARAVGTSRIDLSWSAPRNTGGAPVLGYRIEASDDGGGTWRIIRRNTNSTLRTFSDVNLQPATTRHYRVAAINTAGTGPASNTARATTDATLPGVPRDLTAEADGTSEIDLSWQAPTTDGGAQVSGYRIEVSEDQGANWENLVTNTRNTRTTYSHTGLDPATTRHYRVSAINRIGLGRASSVASATTDATVPDAPTGLVATATTPTRIDLAWVAPAYDGGAPISGYRIEVSETGATWTDLQPNTGTASPTFSAPRTASGKHALLPRLGDQPRGHRRGVGGRFGGDGRSRRTRGTAQHPRPAARGRGDDLEHGLGDRPPRRRGGQRDGDGTARGGERTVLHGREPVRAGRRRRPRPPGPLRPVLPLRRRLVPDAARRHRRTARDIHGHPGGELGRGRVPLPRRTRLERPRLERQHGERPCRRGRASGVRHPRGSCGLVLFGHLRLHRQDRRQPGDRHLRHHDDQRESLPGLVLGRPRQRRVGHGRVRLGRHRGRRPARGAPDQPRPLGDGSGGRQLPAARERHRRRPPQGRGVGRPGHGRWRRAGRLGHARMQRGKLALEWTQGFRSTAGHEVAIVLEGGMRYDNGDGVNGTSGEVGGGLRYSNADVGVTAEGRGRLLVSARDGYEEWGWAA